MSNLFAISVHQPIEDKNYARYWYCNEPTCPLRAKHQCILAHFIQRYCPYGRIRRVNGWTKRARKYNAFLEEHRAKRKELELPTEPKIAAQRLAIIGEYVYIPHAYAVVCEEVPFIQHGRVFVTGRPFVKKAEFTAEMVVALAHFRPRAMMGGEIRDYQAKSVPLLLFDVKTTLPTIWAEAIILCPEIEDKVAKPEAFATTKVSPLILTTGTLVEVSKWQGVWDGEKIVIEQDNTDGIIRLYDSAVEHVRLEITPSEAMRVIVLDREELARLYSEGQFDS